MPIRPLAVALLILAMSACSSTGLPPLTGRREPVDLPRFMGDWYVIAFIPIDVPILGEAGAHNGVESYRLESDGSIATTYRFRDGGFDGPEKVMEPRARVANPPVNTEWRMKFAWFLPAGDYLILSVDPAYQRTIIGVPDRRWVWLMARQPEISATDYDAMVEQIRGLGYETARLRRVPQRWPGFAAGG